jgi:uncharacterized protein YutE (UPF0331/DUF86 family)
VDVAVRGRAGRVVDRLGLAADLCAAARREVDVVDLDEASYPMLRALLRDAIVLHEGRPGAAADWRTRAILETETDRPWFERMRDAYLAHMAAGGAGMVDADLVAAKLRELAERIARVRARVPSQTSTLAADRDTLELIAFNLMLALQSCLDIASHLIADEGWPPAVTLGEAFERLGERGVLDRTTAAALRRATGLRNVVAHGYSAAAPELLHQAATAGLADLERFSQQVSAWVRTRQASADR